MLTAPIHQLTPAPGSRITLPHCTWADYEALLQEWQNRRFPRVLFVEGDLTLMTPLPEHEITNDLLSDMVKSLLEIQGKGYQPFGSTTLTRFIWSS